MVHRPDLATVGLPAFREVRTGLRRKPALGLADWEKEGRQEFSRLPGTRPWFPRRLQPCHIPSEGHDIQRTWHAGNAATARPIQHGSDCPWDHGWPYTKEYQLNLKGSEEYDKVHKQVKKWTVVGNIII